MQWARDNAEKLFTSRPLQHAGNAVLPQFKPTRTKTKATRYSNSAWRRSERERLSELEALNSVNECDFWESLVRECKQQ